MKESVTTSANNSATGSKGLFWKNFAFLFGFGIFAFMIYNIGFASIIANVKHTGWWLLAVIAVWGIIYMINTFAWRAIIYSDNKVNIPFFKIFRMTVSGYALNYITPMGLLGGEPYRIYELKQYTGTNKASASVILYAMMHVCSHFFFWITSVALIAWFVPVSKSLSIILTCIVIICLIVIGLIFHGYKKGMLVKIFNILEKIPFLGKQVKKFTLKNNDRLEIIDEYIRNLHGSQKKTFYFALFAEYMARMVNSFEIYLILLILGQPVSYVHSVIILALSSLFANIVFFSPMQIGTREGGLYLVFSSLSLEAGLGVSVSMITRIRELFWIMVGLIMMKVVNLKYGLLKRSYEN